jgi:hypothetical protein
MTPTDDLTQRVKNAFRVYAKDSHYRIERQIEVLVRYAYEIGVFVGSVQALSNDSGENVDANFVDRLSAVVKQSS